jgi:hypothetical protein
VHLLHLHLYLRGDCDRPTYLPAYIAQGAPLTKEETRTELKGPLKTKKKRQKSFKGGREKRKKVT